MNLFRDAPDARERAVVLPADGHDKVVDPVVLAVDHQLRDHLNTRFNFRSSTRRLSCRSTEKADCALPPRSFG